MADTDTLDPKTKSGIGSNLGSRAMSAAKGYASGGGWAGAAKGALKKPAGDKQNSKPKSGGQQAAGAANNLMDKGDEKAAKIAGTVAGGSAVGDAAVEAVKAKAALEKKITQGNEQARLALKIAEKTGPAGPIIFGVVLFLFFLIFVLSGGAAGSPTDAPQLTIVKTGPPTAVVGQALDYTIKVTYPGTAQDIAITDPLPAGTKFVSSDQKTICDNGPCNDASRTVTWNLKDIVSPGTILSNVNTTLTLKLIATADNSFLINQANGTVIGAGTQPTDGGPIAQGYVPPAPSSDNCGGEWDFSKWPEQNSLGNYGDPLCNFSKDNLRKLIETTETNPEFVNIWYNIIVPGESIGYHPNAYAPPSSGTPDAAGAWGLYQMGSSTPPPPGQAPPAEGKNGPLDRGDVNWELQTSNAIRYNREKIHCNFEYWSTASSIWDKYSC